jgi:hypothetical protein
MSSGADVVGPDLHRLEGRGAVRNDHRYVGRVASACDRDPVPCGVGCSAGRTSTGRCRGTPRTMHRNPSASLATSLVSLFNRLRESGDRAGAPSTPKTTTRPACGMGCRMRNANVRPTGAAHSRVPAPSRCPPDVSGLRRRGQANAWANTRWKNRGATYDAFKVRLTERLLAAKFAAHMPEAAM